MSVRGPLRKKTLAGIRGVNSSPGCTRAGAERGERREETPGEETQGNREFSVTTLLEVALFAMLLLNCKTVGIVQVQFLLL